MFREAVDAGRFSRLSWAVRASQDSMETLTRSGLAEAIFAQVGLSRSESALLLESVLEAMSRSLEAGEAVKITGFGTFAVRSKGQRIGRNPKTGEEVPISPRRVLTFRPSQQLRARINGEPIPAEPVPA
ncbi:integration host factor subunit alpha [Sabulicella rubraurantiaca]|uniref:integration host factor subunit alpha n=1 Tax=Sabulicella rubraurantiaca TaxID=2811429 RepID=UPI0022A8737D|nr:integration host factor subunit alpha [Sabulicella rubraurantiaca]